MGWLAQTSERIHPITSPLGNTLPLTDARGNLVPDASRILHAFMFFPDDPVTAWAFVDTLSYVTENNELHDFEGKDPRVSTFFTSTIGKSLNQIRVAVMIGQTLILGGMQGIPMSQRRAIHVVQKQLEAKNSTARFPTDERNLRASFQRFEPSIHLLFSMISLSENTWNMLELKEQALRDFLAAAVFFQGIFAIKAGIRDWRPWVIDSQFANPDHKVTMQGLSERALKFAETYRAVPDRI